MAQSDARCAGEALECAHLVGTVFEDLSFRSGHLSSTKVPPIGKTRMGAGLDAVRHGRLQRRVSGAWIPGVKSTGNVDRRNDCHQFAIVSAPFAEIAVQ